MFKNRRIIFRIVRNAGVAAGLNLAVILLVILFEPFVRDTAGAIRSVRIFHFMIMLPCLFNVFLLAAAGGIMAVREERKARKKGLIREEPLGRAELLEQIICQEGLPKCIHEYISLVVKRMRYRFKIRQEVAQELTDHFTDALADCEDETEKQKIAEKMIAEFGDVELLAKFIRRGKKRCRPLWQTIAARAFQTVGILVVVFSLYSLWFMMGRANPSIDYFILLNQKWNPKVADKDNAWLHYEKAKAFFVWPDKPIKKLVENTPIGSEDFKKLTDEEKAAMAKWLKANEATWLEFAAGSLKKSCHYQKSERFDGPKWLANTVVTFATTEVFLRYFGGLGIWRLAMELENGDTRQAVEDCLVMVNLSRNIRQNGNVFEHMIGMLIEDTAYNGLVYAVENKKLSAEELNKYQQRLSQVYSSGYPMIDIEGIRFEFLDTVQHLFTDGGPGGGHLIPGKLNALYSLWYSGPDSEYENRSMFFRIADSMIHAGRDETTARFTEIYDYISKDVQRSPYQRHINSTTSTDPRLALPMYKYFLIHRLSPHLRGRSGRVYQGKSQYEATITIFALQRWRLEKDGYPEKLDELVEGGYLENLPMDPYSDKPLVYKKTDEGFMLYSVGFNFTDDGGKVVKKKGIKSPFTEEGDTVFWPAH